MEEQFSYLNRSVNKLMCISRFLFIMTECEIVLFLNWQHVQEQGGRSETLVPICITTQCQS